MPADPANDKPEFVSVRRVSELYGWHKSTTHRLLKAQKITGKSVRDVGRVTTIRRLWLPLITINRNCWRGLTGTRPSDLTLDASE